jgi:Domain of unknown function (DUF5680)
MDVEVLAQFLVEAKRSTYASQQGQIVPSRKGSKDLAYRKGEYYYVDSYVGEKDFSGQEIVYLRDEPIWSMNYYGWMLRDDVPAGFIETLRGALLRVETNRPFRGCPMYSQGKYIYRCDTQGAAVHFVGREWIEYDGAEVYSLYFHGGQIRK